MSAPYTPGPWTVTGSEVFADSGATLISKVADLGLGRKGPGIANQALIAASPDLYLALADLLTVINGAGWLRHPGDSIERAEAAIAKVLYRPAPQPRLLYECIQRDDTVRIIMLNPDEMARMAAHCPGISFLPMRVKKPEVTP